jgi:quinol monooxygenase YgiN
MFARIVEFIPKADKKEEVISVLRRDVLPILKKQGGFLDFLPLVPENAQDKVIGISIWAEKTEADRYEREAFPRVEAILKPYLTSSVTCKHYNVETSLCQHLAESLWSEV